MSLRTEPIMPNPEQFPTFQMTDPEIISHLSYLVNTEHDDGISGADLIDWLYEQLGNDQA